MRAAATFTAFLVNQVISSRTQALIADLQVIANMRAAAIVVQALIGACSGKKKRFTISFFFWRMYVRILNLHTTTINERPFALTTFPERLI